MQKPLVVLVLPLAFLAAACNGGGAQEAGPVPTAPASTQSTGTSTAEPTTTGSGSGSSTIRLCADETAGVSVASSEGAAGTIRTVWRATNEAEQACRSTGYPGMDFRTATGWLNVRVHRGGFADINGQPTRVVLRPGESLYFVSYWNDVSTNGGPCKPFERVKVTLPDNFVSARVVSSGCLNPDSVDVGPVTTSPPS